MADNPNPLVNLKGDRPSIVTPFQHSQDNVAQYDPFLELQAFVKKATPKQAFAPTYMAEAEIDRTGRYPYTIPGRDNEQAYAVHQGFWEKAGHGIMKGVGIAGTTFTSGTVGLLYGLSQWLEDGKFSSFYDNDLNRALDEFNQKWENEFANYYAQDERENPMALRNIFSGNFVFDKLVKNMGFSAGAMLAGVGWGAALRATGLMARAAQAGKQWELLNSVEAGIEAVPQAQKAKTTIDAIRGFAQKELPSFIGKYGLQNAERAVVAGFGTVGEAALESLHNRQEFIDARVKEFEKINGYTPTGEAYRQIADSAESVGNWSFGLNTALLSFTNYIQFPKILNSSFKAGRSIVTGAETQALRNTAGLVESALPKAGLAKRYVQAKNIARLFVSPSEGFEEGAQYAITLGTQDYFEKGYKQQDRSFLDSADTAIGNTLHSKEGVENILIGALSGGLMESGAFRGFRGGLVGERGFTGYGGEKAKATAEALSAMNTASFRRYMKDGVETVNRAMVLERDKEAALRQGDILEYKDAEHDYAHNYVAQRVKYGKLDLVMDEISDMREAATLDFEKLKQDGYAADTDTQTAFLKRLDNLERHAKYADSLYKTLNLRYAEEVAKDKDGKVILENGKPKKRFTPEVIDRLVYAATKIKDYDQRIEEISGGLILQGIAVQDLLDLTSNNEASPLTESEIEKGLKEIQKKKDLLPEQKEELKTALRDVVEISLRRKNFYNEYDQVRNNPEKYTYREDKEGQLVNEQGKKKRTTTPSNTPFDSKSRPKFKGDVRSYEELSKQYGEGEVNQRDVLRKVMQSPYATTREKALAAAFLNLTSATDTVHLGDRNLASSGVYNGKDVRVNYEASAHDYEGGDTAFEHVLLHELGHRYTVNELRTNKKFREKIATLYEAAKSAYEQNKDLVNTAKGSDLPYYAFFQYKPGEDDYMEFVTEALSNQSFQAFLASVPYKNTQRSAWEEFLGELKDFVRRLLGLEDESLLDEVVGVITNNISKKFKSYKEEIEQEEKERREAEEKLRQLQAQKEKLLKEGGLPSGAPGGEDTSEDDPKKRIERLFNSTTANPNDQKEREADRQAFLAKADFLPFREELHEVVVTVNNEEALGLKGLVSSFTKGTEYAGKEADPENGPILKVIVRQYNGGHFFVDREGNTIGQVGQQADITKVLAGTAPLASLNWSSEYGKQQNYSHAKPDEAELWKEAWAEKRKEIFGWKGENYFPLNISRGTGPKRPKKQLRVRNSVLGTLIPKSLRRLLDTAEVVQVTKQGFHMLNGELIPVPVGRPFFVYRSTFEFLDNRLLSENEAETIYEVLKEITRDVLAGHGIQDKWRLFLDGLVYFAKPTDDQGNPKPLTSGNIFLDDYHWNLGRATDTDPALKVEFTLSSLESNKTAIINTLRGMHNNVNSFKLTQLKGRSYDEFYLEDGELKVRTWPSYQHYLISDQMPDGSARTTLPLATSLSAVDEADPKDRLFKYRYTWTPGLVSEPDMSSLQRKPASKKETPPKETTAPKEAAPGTLVGDGKTIHTWTSKFFAYSFKFTYDQTTEELNIQQDEGYEAARKLATPKIQGTDWTEDEFIAFNILNAYVQPILDQQLNQAQPTAPSSKEAAEPKVQEEPDDDVFDKGVKQGVPVVNREEAKRLIRYLSRKHRIRAALENMGLFGSYGTYSNRSKTITINSATTLDEQGNLSVTTNPEGTGYIPRRTIFHEFLHPFVGLLRDQNPMLYQQLVREARENVKEDLSHYDAAQQDEEYLVRRLEKLSDTDKPPTLWQRFINWLSRLLFGKRTNRSASLAQLSLNTTVDELYDVFKNYGVITGTEDVSQAVKQDFRRSAEAGLGPADTYRVVQGLATKVFQQFARDVRSGIRSFVELDTSEFTIGEYFENAFVSYDKDLRSQGTEFARVRTVVNQNKPYYSRLVMDYLRSLNIRPKNDEEEEDNESEDANFAGNTDEGYLKDHFTWDGKRNATASVRLMISTIMETELKDGRLVPVRDEHTFAVRMVDPTKVFNQLYHELSPLNTLQQKENRVKELARQYPAIASIAARLGLDKSVGTIDELALRAKFFHTFSRQRPIALKVVLEDGNSFIKESNNTDAVRRLSSEWLDRTKWQNDSGLVSYSEEEGAWVLNQTEVHKRLPQSIRSRADQLKVLSILGIPSEAENWEALSVKDLEKFQNRVSRIYDLLKKPTKKTATTPADLGLESPFRDLAALYIKSSGEYPESTYYSIEQKPKQEFVPPNTVSAMINDINQAASMEEVLSVLPHLNSQYSKGSLYLNDKEIERAKNERRPVFEIEYNEGTEDRENDRVHVIERMSEPVRVVQEINNNLQGHFYIVIPADGKTEWTIKVNPVMGYTDTVSENLWIKAHQIFNTYYQQEKALMKGKNPKERLLGVIAGYEKDSLTIGDVRTYIKQKVQSQIEFLLQFGQLEEQGDDSFALPWLNTDFASRYGLDKSDLTRAQLEQILTYRTINYLANQVEMMKLFFGDPASYGSVENLLKRVKSFLSPREMSVFNWNELDDTLNTEYNKSGNLQMKPGDFGYYTHKSYMETITMSMEKTVAAEIADDKTLPYEVAIPYKEGSDGTDGQTWATLPGYREMRVKRGYTWTKQDNKVYEQIMARDRQLMLADGMLTEKEYRKELQEADKKLLETPMSARGVLYVLKPVGSGFTTAGDQFLDKTSVFPMTYEATRGKGGPTALSHHYVQMVKQGLAYAAMDSARKVGQGTLNPFYKDGKANTEYKGIIGIPFRYFGVQTETEGSHDSQTTGSQMAKYVTANIYDNGKPTDYKGTLEEWLALSEEERMMASERHRLATENASIRRKMVEHGYYKLLKEFGIKETEYDGEMFPVIDLKIMQKLLSRELFRREVPYNIRQALSVNENGEWNVPLEALNNYRQVRNILYSYVRKYVSKPKVNGGPRIQVSGAGFEVNGTRVETRKVNGKDTYVSKSLKMYEAEYDNGGNRVKVNKMEVLVNNSVADKLRRINPGMKEEEMIDYLNNHPDGQKILSGIGFRIPTQEMNSIDVFIIKGFLPSYYGDTVVVPEALTTKTGSDFDVDKLSTYMRNLIVVGKKLEVVKSFDSREDHDDYYGKIFDAKLKKELKFVNRKLDELEGNESSGMGALLKEAGFETEELDMDLDQLWERYNVLTDQEFQAELRQSFLDKTYGQGLENAYFDNMEALILHPDNYARLVKPNDASRSKNISLELQKIAPKEFGQDAATLLDPLVMARLRHKFLAARNWIGIAATQATAHSLTQKFPVILNLNRTEYLSEEEKKIIGNGIIALPHNTVNIKGHNYSTISAIESVDKHMISDTLSRRLDGSVDAVKNPWIASLIQSTEMVDLFLFLDRMGVPEEVTSYFLNQPIIRKYNHLMEQRKKDVYENQVIKDVLSEFPIRDDEEEKDFFVSRFEQKTPAELASHLKSMIASFYNGGTFSLEENAEQRMIFREFRKYQLMAAHLKRFNAALSYDTQNFSDLNLYELKTRQTREEEKTNLFSSVQRTLQHTYIGKIRDMVGRSNEVIGMTLFKFDHPDYRKYVAPYLTQLQKYIRGKDKYVFAARRVEQSLIHYLLHVSGLNSRIEELMINPDTNIAKQLEQIRASVTGEISKNIVLEQLKASAGVRPTASKNVALFSKAYDIFTSNIYTAALRELREDPQTSEFYKNLVDAVLIQAGISSQRNSLSDILPNEDLAKKIEGALLLLNDTEVMGAYAANEVFYRNMWWNTDVIPRTVYRGKDMLDNPQWLQDLGAQTFAYRINVKSYRSKAPYVTLRRVKTQFQDRIDPETGAVISSRAQIKKMKRRGDYSFMETILLRRVEKDGVPVKAAFKSNYYNYYVPVTAYGDGQRAMEFYHNGAPTVLHNDTYRPAAEAPLNKIADSFIAFLTGKKRDFTVTEDFSEPVDEAGIPQVKTKFKELDTWTRATKKESFTLGYDDGSGATEVEGYPIKMDGHPKMEVMLYKRANTHKSNQWAVSVPGKGMIAYGGTMKDAVENAIELINKAVANGTHDELLRSIGVTSNAKDEITEVLNKKDAGCKGK
jgi:hypothetical protein